MLRHSLSCRPAFWNCLAYHRPSTLNWQKIHESQNHFSEWKVLLPSLNDIEHHLAYIDPEDDKLRETDVSWFVSSQHKGKPSIFYDFCFECKSSEKYSWVFFTEADSAWQPSSVNLATLAILPDLYTNPPKVLGSPIFYGRSSKIAYSYLTFPENAPDNIRSAIFQAIKPGFVDAKAYFDDLISENKDFIETATLFLPVIVYSGYMFEYEHASTGDKLFPTKHVVVKVEHYFYGKRYNFYVDVVRADYLSQYLDKQAEDIANICNYMEKAKPPIRQVRFQQITKTVRLG